MKHFYFSAFLTLILFNCQAQNRTATEPLLAKFITYFNAGQADSVYSLVADEFKQKVPLPNLNAVFTQLKPFGQLLKSEFIGSKNGITNYIIDFEKSPLVLSLNFDKNNKVVGFFEIENKREKVVLKAAEETVTVKTGSSVIKGTLSVPKAARKIPVVLLIAGSGPTDRNGNSSLIPGKLNYLSEISDSLATQNIAVLRYDKRGIGESSTNKSENESIFEDLVDDVSAIITHLKADNRFSKIILAGHSEGSLVGMLASQRQKVDGFISLAGPGFNIDTILKKQLEAGLPAKDLKVALNVLDSIKLGREVKQKLSPALETIFRESVRPFLTSLMKYNPQTELAKLTIPVAIVQGTNDIQVGIENAKELKAAKPAAKLVLIEGMSHILKEAPANREQNIATYSNNDLRLHPKLISALSQFIWSVQ